MIINEYSDFTIDARYNYNVTKWVAEIYHLNELVYTTGEFNTEYQAREYAASYLTSHILTILTDHDTWDHSAALATAVLDDLGDVNAPSPATNNILIRSGGLWVDAAQTSIDHGSIGGLGDDDHAQYLNNTRHDALDHSTALGTAVIDDLSDVAITTPAANHVIIRNGGNTAWINSAQTGIDHGSIAGLADDDHTQYHDDTRGDARYPLKTVLTAKGSIYAATATSTPGELTVGANNTVLMADSAAGTGIKWAAQSLIDHNSLNNLTTGDVHTQYTRKDTLTTKGDIYAASGASTPARRAVGTDKQVLVSDSTQGTGLNWDWVGVPTGAIMQFGSHYFPTGWLECDGTAANRTTYANLFDAIVPTIGTFTVTIASPGVVTLNSHGLQDGDAVYLTTTGALPTGLSQNTIYYVKYVGVNSFQLSTTRTTAYGAGTSINTSGTQSGTHTLRYCPWGLGDGSTTFNLPNFTQRIPMGRKTTSLFVPQGMFDAHVTTDNGSTSGSHFHTGSLSGSTGVASVGHTHDTQVPCGSKTASTSTGASANHTHGLSSGTSTINTTNSPHTHTVYGIGVTWMIKT